MAEENKNHPGGDISSGASSRKVNDTPKTPVQITQQLLALLAAKKEKEGSAGSNDIIQSLRDELSLYGDSVESTVDRTDPYFDKNEHNQRSFADAVKRLRSEAGEIPESLDRIFTQLLSGAH